ncbi:hypothetical protein GYB22_04340 [bacterium]|nr:hypothetical protein [bacterium]
MNLFRKIEQLKAQILDSERMLDMVVDHPLMAEGIKEKINELKIELEKIPKEAFEPTIQLLFSGKSVIGSQGIKSSFVVKTVNSLQEMVKTQAALVRFGEVGKRGRRRKGATTDLYLTALPVGSFGVELSQLEANDLFDSIDVSNAIKQVMHIIESSTIDDETFEKIIAEVPKRNLTNLRKLLEEVAENDSILKMESNEIGIQISEQKVKEAFERVAETTDKESELIIQGVFRGLLLDSGRFEIQDSNEKKLSGFISPDLSEDELISYDQNFLNQECIIILKQHVTTFKTGNEKIEFELIEIKASN